MTDERIQAAANEIAEHTSRRSIQLRASAPSRHPHRKTPGWHPPNEEIFSVLWRAHCNPLSEQPARFLRALPHCLLFKGCITKRGLVSRVRRPGGCEHVLLRLPGRSGSHSEETAFPARRSIDRPKCLSPEREREREREGACQRPCEQWNRQREPAYFAPLADLADYTACYQIESAHDLPIQET